jgi:hypothetical protein
MLVTLLPVKTFCPSTIMPAPPVTKRTPPPARMLNWLDVVEKNNGLYISAQTNAP